MERLARHLPAVRAFEGLPTTVIIKEEKMKKIISVLLLAMVLFSIANVAVAEEKPQYVITNLAYDGSNVTGNVIHVAGTPEVSKIKVRVTMYIGSIYMATEASVNDGKFVLMAIGPINYITAVANAVDDLGGRTRLHAAELFV